MIPVIRPWMGEEEAEAAAEAIRSGWVAQGPRVREFEEAVARHVGAAQGVAVSSCTTALHLTLHALGLGPGDEVVVPSLSFIATANAPVYVGATPVFADVDPITMNLSADTVAPVLGPATRAVILVHQVGMPADIDAVQEVCEGRGVHLIEDAACAVGSTYRGRPVGGHSPFVAFSFHPRKVLTTGEGGMVMVQDSETAARLRRLRQHGMSMSAFDRHDARASDFESYLETGFNFRMTDIQAAVGLVQLGKLDSMVARRRALAGRYRQLLAGVPFLTLPTDPSYGTTTYQSYVVTVSPEAPVSRDELMDRLHERGISTRRGVMAAHREPAFAGHRHRDLPVTEFLTDQTLILPLFHEMTDADQERVVEALRSELKP